MDLSKLLDLAIADNDFSGPLKAGAGRLVLLEAARPYFLAALYRILHRPVLIVTARPEDSRRLYDQLIGWSAVDTLRYPELDTQPYERSPVDSQTGTERVRVLAALARCADGGATLVVASAAALMNKAPPVRDFTASCHTIEVGMEIDPYQLMRRWERMGYCTEAVVEVPGTVSKRGGIVDIYPPGADMPVRLEFFGNRVDSIRRFEPASQRSRGKLDSVNVIPAAAAGLDSENDAQFTGNTAGSDQDSLLDYLPEETLIVLEEPSLVRQVFDELYAEAEQIRGNKVARAELPPEVARPYFNWADIEAKAGDRARLLLEAWSDDGSPPGVRFTPVPAFAGQLPAFIEKVKQLLDQKRPVVIVSQQARRLAELFYERDILVTPVTEVTQPPVPGGLTLVEGSLNEGWSLRDVSLFTDCEIFGFIKQQRLTRKRPVARHKLFADIRPGDHVVHIEHGIGKFTGFVTMGPEGKEKEYLVLQYAAGDRLYVPSEQVDRISRYVGAGDEAPVLSRLGTQEWSKAKQKAREAAEELAGELLALYASREINPGFAFSPDTVWQQELEASFPYVETPDQLQAQAQVKSDMEKPRPMDRLVCGDVGYGKTEVAIRAAFKAVMDGRQAAVLVPTTVLAEQHFITFSQRMEAFPVKVESLSRFKSPREQRAVIEGLANGAVDIVIGTHRLLQKDVVFKDLGLLVIDEEQRFGVVHKEHFKKLRREIDVLTLSATPIPRTLHMSLAGVRDISMIETPPEERLPVKTHVAEYNGDTIRHAIIRELERNGQVFLVHNRVHGLARLAAEVKTLVPEARIAVGHGQMPEDELEQVMADFVRGRYDVLLCTTIIESGLDMPNVNTIIVNQADKLGLTQLYQLRGRVGRGANLAYAYFLYDKGKPLTAVARKRLRTIFEATELGAGFNIAMKDLEIRGAGSILGTRQSGHISAVGFSLYTRLLAEAVEGLKAQRGSIKTPAAPRLPEPVIDLPFKAFIPGDYVEDVNTRLELYQGLAELRQPEEVEDKTGELRDRFGSLPPEVRNLLYAVRLRAEAAGAVIESIRSEDSRIVISLFDGLQVDRRKIGELPEGVRVGSNQVSLDLTRLRQSWQAVLEEVVRRLARPSPVIAGSRSGPG
ncbi:MAG: transcription-repair coupling factor [Chloroflexi bacterium]|nr:transcription-repair coupling factor [Chloroflexota bacterium]